jgi:hypothetical protein
MDSNYAYKYYTRHSLSIQLGNPFTAATQIEIPATVKATYPS